MFAFYRELGISDKAARVFMAAEPGNDAIWLTADLAASLGIKVVTVDAQAKAAQAKAAQAEGPEAREPV